MANKSETEDFGVLIGGGLQLLDDVGDGKCLDVLPPPVSVDVDVGGNFSGSCEGI